MRLYVSIVFIQDFLILVVWVGRSALINQPGISVVTLAPQVCHFFVFKLLGYEDLGPSVKLSVLLLNKVFRGRIGRVQIVPANFLTCT